jgi:hypothetical protein
MQGSRITNIFNSRHALIRYQKLCILSLLACLIPSIDAAVFKVSSPAEFSVSMAKALPGDSLVLKSGIWNGAILRLSGKGLENQPITILAETAGMVVLTGPARVEFLGDWITLAGIKMEKATGTQPFISFGPGTHHCRLTNSAILDSKNGTANWIHVQVGTFHRIDHCRFSGMNQPGEQIQFEVDPLIPGDHTVDNCLFMDRSPGNGNGFETIRIGYSHQQNNLGRVTFERNLFLRCNGENEIISNKSTGNRILHNTFRDNSGEMTCRHGDKAWIEGNFFLHQGRGIRLIGSDHTVINNYIADMQTDGISLYNGAANPEPTGYEAANNAVIAFNTIVNCPVGIAIGDGGENVVPKNITIANNALLIPSGNAIHYVTATPGVRYQGNQYQGLGSGASDAGVGLIQKDIRLVKGPDGIYRPSFESPLKDAALGAWTEVIRDLNELYRQDAKDVGAFELGNLPLGRPLTETEVGPYWMGNTTTKAQSIKPRMNPKSRSFIGFNLLGRFY